MADPLDNWKQQTIEGLPTGEVWRGPDFFISRYRDGWYVFWNNSVSNRDVGRFFDEDHLWELRNFMNGKWSGGVVIGVQSPE